jgi:hypothetical protein
VVNHGADHAADETLSTDDPGYSRHAYSTHAGPWYDGSPMDGAVDGHVALLDPRGRASHRRPLRPVKIRGREAVSRHRAHWPVGEAPERTWPPRQPEFRTGPWLTTASVLRGAVEVRLARVDPDAAFEDAAASDGPWTLRIGGYAVATAAADARPIAAADGATATARRADGLTSTVTGLLGLPAAAVLERDGVDAYGAHSAVPYVTSGGPVRPGEVYAAAIVLSGAPGAPDLPTVTVTPDGDVVVRWPDGVEDHLSLEG